MNPVDQLMDNATVIALGWTLVHFLWQATAAAVLLLLLRRLCQSSNARYVMSLGTLLACAASAAITFTIVRPAHESKIANRPSLIATVSPSESPSLYPAANLPASAGPEGVAAGKNKRISDYISDAAPAVVCVWMIGAMLLAIWRLLGWLWAIYLSRVSPKLDQAPLRARLDRLRSLLNIKRAVRMLRCDLLDGPAVIGWLRPAILLPIGCLTNLSPDQLDAILAHELAHIRRFDYLANLLQMVIETALFFHPAVWWISSKIREDREDCCDDIAARVCGDRLIYAQALEALEGLRAAPQPALAATGGTLMRRLQRLLGMETNTPKASWWPAGVLAMVMVAMLSMQSQSAAQNNPKPRPKSDDQSLSLLCIDPDGKPVAGVKIFLIEVFFRNEDTGKIAPAVSTTAVSDADGIAHLSTAPTDPDHDRRAQYFYGVLPGKFAGALEMSRGETTLLRTDEPTMYLMPAVALKAKIAMPPGVDPTKVGYQVMSINSRAPASHRGPNGEFITIGNFMRFEQTSFWPEVFDHSLAADGTLAIPDVPNDANVTLMLAGPGVEQHALDLSLRKGLEISTALHPEGIIKGKLISSPSGGPVGGVKVYASCNVVPLIDSSIGFSVTTTTEPDGSFTLRGLQQAVYTIGTRTPDGWTSSPIKQQVRFGEKIENIELSLVGGVVLNGICTDADTDQPLAGTLIFVSQQGETVGTARRTGPDGRFSVRAPFGKVRVYVSGPPEGYVQPYNSFKGGASYPGVTLDLSNPPGEQPDLKFPLKRTPPAATQPQVATIIRGRVIDFDGKPVAKVIVGDGYFDKLPATTWNVVTETDGRYELKYDPARIPEDLNRRMVIRQDFTTSAESKPFTVKLHETNQVEDIVVERRTIVSQLSGIVVGPDHKPIENAVVHVEMRHVMTGADGRFKIDLYDTDPEHVSIQAASYEYRSWSDIPAGSKDAEFVLGYPTALRDVANPTKLPLPARLIGKPAPSLDVESWVANGPGVEKQISLKRDDGKSTVVLFPECCVSGEVYRQQLALAEAICKRQGAKLVVIFPPGYHELAVRSYFNGAPLQSAIGIDRRRQQLTETGAGVTWAAYGTEDSTKHTILVIRPNGVISDYTQDLSGLETALKNTIE